MGAWTVARGPFEKIGYFGFVLPKYRFHILKLKFVIHAITLMLPSRFVEGANGKFAPRQRSPLIPVHGQ